MLQCPYAEDGFYTTRRSQSMPGVWLSRAKQWYVIFKQTLYSLAFCCIVIDGSSTVCIDVADVLWLQACFWKCQLHGIVSVSSTHLDVYKRQGIDCCWNSFVANHIAKPVLVSYSPHRCLNAATVVCAVVFSSIGVYSGWKRASPLMPHSTTSISFSFIPCVDNMLSIFSCTDAAVGLCSIFNCSILQILLALVLVIVKNAAPSPPILPCVLLCCNSCRLFGSSFFQ